MRSASSVSSAARVQGTAFVVLFVIGFAHLLNDMIQSVVPAVYPLIKEKFGLSFAQIGIITLVFQLTSSILQPFVGRYADRHPRPYSLFVGMCFTLVGLCALAVAPDFRVLVAAVSIIGFGSSIFHPEASQVAQLASGGRKGLAQSIFQVGGNGGTAVGPLLAALVVVPYGQGAIGFLWRPSLRRSFSCGWASGTAGSWPMPGPFPGLWIPRAAVCPARRSGGPWRC